MLKGKTRIILTDVNTGEQEVHEDENIVTNALDKLINIEVARNYPLNDHVLPIATNALGGIMLFDDDLTENRRNIHFPVEAHLVGYAGQNVNTSDNMRGSYNSIESGKTERGFVSVWDFGTGQANGTIKSVARTHAVAGDCPIYRFRGGAAPSTSNGAPDSDSGWLPIRYEDEYVYMIKINTSAHTGRLARVKVPMMAQGCTDYSNASRSYEVLATWNTEMTTYQTSRYEDMRDPSTYTVYADDWINYEDGGDGYFYCIAYNATAGNYRSYDYDLSYFTIKYSDESFTKSETVRVSLGVQGHGGSNSYGMNWANRRFGHVKKGILYMLGADLRTIYRIPLSNPSAYSASRIFDSSERDYIATLGYTSPNNGGVYFDTYHYLQNGYEYRCGILYPDGYYVIANVSYSGTGTNPNMTGRYYTSMTHDDDLINLWYYSHSTSQNLCRDFVANYLGTINNLSSAITKTAAQTMKIVYTLEDVDE